MSFRPSSETPFEQTSNVITLIVTFPIPVKVGVVDLVGETNVDNFFVEYHSLPNYYSDPLVSL